MFAIAFALAALHGAAPPAAQPAMEQMANAAELAPANLADRRMRVVKLIRAGRRDEWLTRDEAREAFRTLRSIRNQEERWRGVGNRELTAAEQAELHRRLGDLSQSLRWKREREGGGHRRVHQ